MFTEQKFNIPALTGISAKNIEEHLKLYAGYVKHANLIQTKIKDLLSQKEVDMYTFGELNRRFGFEFDGMRNHEVYFKHFEGGATALSEESSLHKAITKQWGSLDSFMIAFKALASTRGPGWAMLYVDSVTKELVTTWVDEQHLGQLVGAAPVLALDCWEHAFAFDYQPSGRKVYIEDFFKNLNWNHPCELYEAARK